MLDQELQSGDQKGFDFLLLMIDSNVENEKKELMQNSKVPSPNNEQETEETWCRFVGPPKMILTRFKLINKDV